MTIATNPFPRRADQGLLLAGIAKDVRRALPHVLKNAESYGQLFSEYKIIIVENGSTDGTKEFLRRWAREREGRIHIEADSIRPTQSHSNPRGAQVPLLSAYRNLCLEQVLNEDRKRFPYVCIFDCDEVTVKPVNLEAIRQGIEFLASDGSRAAIFANQRGYYYDIWALRHDIWCPGDCWKELKAWCLAGLPGEAAQSCIGSKQVHIPADAPPIEVNSAFGGLSVYKTTFLIGCNYEDFDESGSVVCEHVSLNQQIRQRGGRLFIFPSLRISTPYTHILRYRDYTYWSTRLNETLWRGMP